MCDLYKQSLLYNSHTYIKCQLIFVAPLITTPVIFCRELMVTNEAGLEPETINLDASDIAGWNTEIFGKKK